MTVVHDFTDALARSGGAQRARLAEAVYREHFPNLACLSAVAGDEWAQRAGVDRIIVLDGGKVLKVEEKWDEAETGNIFVEMWSVHERRVKGWAARDLDCDYLAYMVCSRQMCYLLPFYTFRQTYRRCIVDWVRRYGRKHVRNGTYTTVGVAVPIALVLNEMRATLAVRWSQPGAAHQAQEHGGSG